MQPLNDRPNPGSQRQGMSDFLSDNKFIQMLIKLVVICLALMFALFIVMLGLSFCQQMYQALTHGFRDITHRISYGFGRIDPTLFWGMFLIAIVGIIRLLKK